MEVLERPRVIRRRRDVLLLLAGAAVVTGSTIAAQAPLSRLETDVFRGVNDLSQGLRPVIWPFMQFGTFITIPLLAAIALIWRRYRFSGALLGAGVGVYLVARVIKGAVERGRPGDLLDDVQMREVFGEGSLGFPSGHAAVAAALIVVASAYLATRWIVLACILGGIVVAGRMYVGAHLPLDLVGGFALGVVAGAGANLLLGVPPDRSPGTTLSAGSTDGTADGR
jgi:membrane-associated phospholipid phosphatase